MPDSERSVNAVGCPTTAPEAVLRPPIPAALAHRPTLGGLVVPWINLPLRDGGVDFRGTHGTKWRRAWTEGVCQTCGEHLTERPIVMLGGPNQLAGYFTEPPLHPVCAACAVKACPMVAGRQPQYADRPQLAHGPRGSVCWLPDCDCGGWVPDDGETHYGAPAHEWWAVWCDDWKIAVDKTGKLLGGVPVGERRRRLISIPNGVSTPIESEAVNA